METDIGNPIEYDPSIDNIKDDKVLNEEESHSPPQMQIDPYYYQQQPMMYQNQPEKTDILANIDKSTWIIAFAVFLLGFFMGKTMQPVILRYT